MMDQLTRICSTIDYYIKLGWGIDYMGDIDINHNYIISSPEGSAFRSGDLVYTFCAICDEDDPNWEQDWCYLSDNLLREEANARNLYSFIRLQKK
jgi:hypothetical protein